MYNEVDRITNERLSTTMATIGLPGLVRPPNPDWLM